MLLLMVLCRLRTFAQYDDEDDFLPGSSAGSLDDMEEFMDYRPIHIGFDDIIMVALLLVACYVFGKIWKGCSYLILVLAAVFYFITH